MNDYDGTIIDSEKRIDYGRSATAPIAPARLGYTFVGWDKSFNNITDDLIVTATYNINKYTVTFKDHDGKTLGTPQSIEYGSDATSEASPTRSGYTFTGWDKAFKNITDNLIVTAAYKINNYTVTFKDFDGTTLGTPQNTNYGGKAIAEPTPTRVGHTFTGWDKTFDNITGDLTVTATYEINKYTVTFKDSDDGTTLGINKV